MEVKLVGVTFLTPVSYTRLMKMSNNEKANSKFFGKRPTTLRIPRRSPIQVLTQPKVA